MKAEVMTEKTEKKVYPYSPKVAAIHKLRINVKSLAAESRFIRKEEKRCGFNYWYELNHHRRVHLRTESRIAQLALAYVREIPFSTVEGKWYEGKPPVDYHRVAKKVAAATGGAVNLYDIQLWVKQS